MDLMSTCPILYNNAVNDQFFECFKNLFSFLFQSFSCIFCVKKTEYAYHRSVNSTINLISMTET